MADLYKKRISPSKVVYYKQICIHCGASQQYKHELSNTIPRPRPNTTNTIRDGGVLSNKVNCFFGSHNYYFEDELEKIR